MFAVNGYRIVFRTQGITRMHIYDGDKSVGHVEVAEGTDLAEVILMAEEKIHYYELDKDND